MGIREIVLEALACVEDSQAELGRRVRRSSAAVSRWASGKSVPDFESCLMLAAMTEHPADDVLRAAGYDPSWLHRVVLNKPAAPQPLSVHEEDLLETFRLLPPSDQPAAIRIVEALAEPMSGTALHGMSGTRAMRTRTGSNRRPPPPSEASGTHVEPTPAVAGIRRAA